MRPASGQAPPACPALTSCSNGYQPLERRPRVDATQPMLQFCSHKQAINQEPGCLKTSARPVRANLNIIVPLGPDRKPAVSLQSISEDLGNDREPIVPGALRARLQTTEAPEPVLLAGASRGVGKVRLDTGHGCPCISTSRVPSCTWRGVSRMRLGGRFELRVLSITR